MINVSIAALLTSRAKFNALLTKLDLTLQSNDWLYRAYEIVEKLAKFQQDGAGDIDLERLRMSVSSEWLEDIAPALYDVIQLYEIIPKIQDEDEVVLKEKLIKLLRASSINREVVENNEPRNTLWELKLLAMLKRCHIQARLGNPNPDILVTFEKRQYLIQCKRIYNKFENSLGRNITKANAQLMADLKEKPLDTLGLIALSVERPTVGFGKAMMSSQSEHEARQIIQNISDKITVTSKDLSSIEDPRIVAMFLHIVVPAEFGKNKKFAPYSDTAVRNIWANTNGFQMFKEDFASFQTEGLSSL